MADFYDHVKIYIKAGNGGNGCISFHREKYVAYGGPDGGDGGRGGSIILRVDNHMSTLMDFRYKRKYSAPNGADGSSKRCTGKDGESLIIKVPRGTIVRDLETNEIICDMSGDEDFVLAKGGNGGWGNVHFATPTRQVPRFAKAGLPGQSPPSRPGANARSRERLGEAPPGQSGGLSAGAPRSRARPGADLELRRPAWKLTRSFLPHPSRLARKEGPPHHIHTHVSALEESSGEAQSGGRFLGTHTRRENTLAGWLAGWLAGGGAASPRARGRRAGGRAGGPWDPDSPPCRAR